MTKQQFLDHVAAIYRVGNFADSDSPQREAWTHPDMAGVACCAALDKMMHQMVRVGVLSAEDLQAFHDSL